jgi:hypothetical protein
MIVLSPRLFYHSGKPKVCDAQLTLLVHQNILWLQVTVQDTLAMQV